MSYAYYDSLPGASWASLLQKNCHTISEARTPEVKDFIGGHGMGGLFTDASSDLFIPHTPFDALTVQTLGSTSSLSATGGKGESRVRRDGAG